MIERIIEFSARNQFMVLALTILLSLAGWWSLQRIPLDAIPDLTDTQVIVYTTWDRSPDLVEDQVTYPIITALLGAPKVRDIRGFSDFGYSFVYVIFEEGTDLYWARSRVQEYLSAVAQKLPAGAKVQLGPDATGLGWVYQYTLLDKSGTHSVEELRSYQDWFLRYHLQATEGVSEVATIGGFQKQYQVEADPFRLASFGLSFDELTAAIRSGNSDTGGRVLEFSGREYMIRGKGYAKSGGDIGDIVVRSNAGVPLRVRDVATVHEGPDMRRGVGDLNGEGDAVSGIVVMRSGENALKVIDRVKEKLELLKPALPAGVEIVENYDRSLLITAAVDTLKDTLFDEMLVVSLIIFLFLLHFPSAIIPIVTLPLAILISFIPLYLSGVTINIMSLGGIAIAIGAMVDAAIVVVEQTHKKLELWERSGKKEHWRDVIVGAIKEVGRPSFYSLLVIAVAFIPIFALEGQEGRLFKPLAFTKNFAMFFAAFLAITLDPALRMLFFREKRFSFRPRFLAAITNAVAVGHITPEERHPLSRILHRLYGPVVDVVLRWPKTVIILALAALLSTVPIYLKLGSEFMPPLYEGTLFYMPTTLPGISSTEAARLLQIQDRIIRTVPEVDRVYGKAGRADTATDPAPLSMMETVIVLKPESEWRTVDRWYRDLPEWLQKPLRHIWRDRITYDDIVSELDKKMNLPGVTNAWTMPIKARIDMLSTGIRTPVGVKVFGRDLAVIEKIGGEIEQAARTLPATRSAFAEKSAGGYFLDFTVKRDAIARYGMSVEAVNEVIMYALGGETIATSIQGRERYGINFRIARELRDDIDKLRRIPVPIPSQLGATPKAQSAGAMEMGPAAAARPAGGYVPLSELAEIAVTYGPSMIRDENGMLSGYVFLDTASSDIGGYVADLRTALKQVTVPPGYSYAVSGQFEFMERVKERLSVIVPITLCLIFFLIYLNTGSTAKTLIVLLAVPFSMIGAFWILYLLGYHLSIAVWVGIIALLGIDAETGIFMLLYLDLAYEDSRKNGTMRNAKDLAAAIHEGAVKRVRPKFMTVATAAIGLVPIMWSLGVGSDVMKRIAAPMIGGLFTSFAMELLIYPAVYLLWKRGQVTDQSAVKAEE